MKTYDVVISNQAKIDLNSIDDYISNELLAPHSALKVMREIKTRIKSLKILPMRYHRYEEEPWFSRGVRVTRVRHYMIFFCVNGDKQKVVILSILYSRRNIVAALEQRAV